MFEMYSVVATLEGAVINIGWNHRTSWYLIKTVEDDCCLWSRNYVTVGTMARSVVHLWEVALQQNLPQKVVGHMKCEKPQMAQRSWKHSWVQAGWTKRTEEENELKPTAEPGRDVFHVSGGETNFPSILRRGMTTRSVRSEKLFGRKSAFFHSLDQSIHIKSIKKTTYHSANWWMTDRETQG